MGGAPARRGRSPRTGGRTRAKGQPGTFACAGRCPCRLRRGVGPASGGVRSLGAAPRRGTSTKDSYEKEVCARTPVWYRTRTPSSIPLFRVRVRSAFLLEGKASSGALARPFTRAPNRLRRRASGFFVHHEGERLLTARCDVFRAARDAPRVAVRGVSGAMIDRRARGFPPSLIAEIPASDPAPPPKPAAQHRQPGDGMPEEGRNQR